MPKNHTFINRLKITRESQQLTQEGLSRKCGINEKQISHYETGHTKPSLANMVRLAKALNVELGWLAGADEQKEKNDDQE